MKKKEAIVVGAGLMAEHRAYLQATNVEPYVIGRPMAFWKEQMPKRMLLRSHIEASISPRRTSAYRSPPTSNDGKAK